jgi:hypothetical protein
MDQLVIMSILQGTPKLLNVLHHLFERNLLSARMMLLERAVRRIIQDEKGDIATDIKVVDAHNMGMAQPGNGAGFLLKRLDIALTQVGRKDFDSGYHIQAYMLAQIDFGKTTTSQQLPQAIVAPVLPNQITHNFMLQAKEKKMGPARR